MKKTITKLLALALAVLMALSLAACGAKDSGAADKVELPVADGAVIGQGATAVTVEVTGADGKTVTLTMTDINNARGECAATYTVGTVTSMAGTKSGCLDSTASSVGNSTVRTSTLLFAASSSGRTLFGQKAVAAMRSRPAWQARAIPSVSMTCVPIPAAAAVAAATKASAKGFVAASAWLRGSSKRSSSVPP